MDNTKINYYGTGRRKSATARVYLVSGSGNLSINGREGLEYLQFNVNYVKLVKEPLQLLGLEGEYNIMVNVIGGGLTGQASAIQLGVARALCQMNLSNRPVLKSSGQLTRDARVKESKKYGLRKARKAPQYSKR
uniref:ribosomal protein S9 n=1 Tax=Rhodella violacea TaxID=2801 RepID=UPI001FCDD177|nr:ribosomal protein S9 [Rhodella violacea]UNJ18020.1 ribosomal protein S9 [Rhodella violacea]